MEEQNQEIKEQIKDLQKTIEGIANKFDEEHLAVTGIKLVLFELAISMLNRQIHDKLEKENNKNKESEEK